MQMFWHKLVLLSHFQAVIWLLVFWLNRRAASFGSTIGDLWDFYGLSVAFRLLSSWLQATRPLRDLKECDGTHSERCVRRVPTLRNKHEHRIRKAHLWASCALSVAIVYLVFIPLYIIVMPYLWYFCFFVPKNRLRLIVRAHWAR